MNRRQAARLALALLIGACALWLAVRGVDWSAATAALLAANLWLVASAVLVVLLGNLSRAMRWRQLFPDPGSAPGVWSLTAAVFIGQAVNNVSPLRVGELARVYALARRTGVSPLIAGGTLVTEKGLELIAALLVVPIAMVTVPALQVREMRPLAVAITWLAALILMVLMGVPRERLDRLLGWMAGRVPLLARWRLVQRTATFLDGVRGGLRSDRLAALAGWTLLGWATAWLTNWLVLLALGIAVSPAAALVLLLVLTFGMLIPAPPARLGVHEYLVVATLALFGVEAGPALAYSLVLRLVVYLPTTAIGAALFVQSIRPRPGAETVSPEAATMLER